MSTRTTFLSSVFLALGLIVSPAIADPLTDLLNQAGLAGLLGDIQGGVEADILNPVGTGDNDLLGLDAFTPENGLGLTLAGTEVLGFGNIQGSSSTAISLDFLGLQQLTELLGLSPDSALVTTLRNMVGPDGALIVPIVNSLGTLSNISELISLPGLSDQPIALAIAGTDSSGNSTADGIAGVALLTPGSSGNGGLIGIAVISGNQSGNGDLVGVSIISGDDSGNGGLTGASVLSGDQSGNSQTLAFSAISGSTTGNGGLVGVGAVNNRESGNGGSVGAAVLNGGDGGNGNTGSVAVGNDPPTGDGDGDGDGPGTCEGIGCGDDGNEDTGLDDRLAAASECAEGDADGDGICDDKDECKNTPAGAAAFRNGCHLDDNTPLILRGVAFLFDSSDLTGESTEVLREARDIIRQHPKTLISIDGHTDAKGSERYNEDLSYRRARSVYRYFIENGIEPERLSIRGFGESIPIAANETENGADYPDGRALNRRVELSVVDREAFDTIKAEVAAREQARQDEQRRAQAAQVRRQEQARKEAAEAEQKKAQAATDEYSDVLGFLEEDGAADTRSEQGDDGAKNERENPDYSVEVIEPERS